MPFCPRLFCLPCRLQAALKVPNTSVAPCFAANVYMHTAPYATSASMQVLHFWSSAESLAGADLGPGRLERNRILGMSFLSWFWCFWNWLPALLRSEDSGGYSSGGGVYRAMWPSKLRSPGRWARRSELCEESWERKEASQLYVKYLEVSVLPEESLFLPHLRG